MRPAGFCFPLTSGEMHALQNTLLSAAFALVLTTFPLIAAAEGVAIFAGACFWCLEDSMTRVRGVLVVEAGYVGGTTPNPTYREVALGRSDHYAAVRVVYDPEQTSYRRLLRAYFLSIDPSDAEGQFCERGPGYRTALFPVTDAQERDAERAIEIVTEIIGSPPATKILQPTDFWPAEEVHQDYADKNPLRFTFYQRACGRIAGLQSIWTQQRAFNLRP